MRCNINTRNPDPRVNPCGAETEMLRHSYANTIVANAVALYVARSSGGMI